MRGDDQLRGWYGDNRLEGGNGNDRLAGLGGNDVLIGGSGADVFVIGRDADEIRDFEPGVDHVQVGFGFQSGAEVLAFIADGATGAVLDLYDGDTTTFTGVAAASLSASDFIVG